MVTRFKTSSGRPVRPRSFSRAALSAVAALAVVVSAVAPASAGAPTAGASTGTGSAATAAASTGTNPAPLVVPAIGTWRGGSGDYTLPKVVTVRVAATDRASLATLRSTFAPELASTSGRQVVVTPGTNGARSGDIVAVVDPARHDLGAEGYDLDIGDSVRLTAGTDAGLFYGTRTLLQLAHQGASFPQGEALDVPRYAERGVGVCACYIHFSMAFFQRLILDASYLKLNQLQLELKVKSSTHPEVNTWGYYTVAEIKSIQALASKYHITVIPEVNSPGHIDPWISGDPQLQLVNAAGVAQPSRLDITKPAAFTFLTSIIDDYFKVFNTPYWHMGADEYMLGSDYANYPQLAAYAKRKFGPNAVPQDAFVDFVNRIDAYVRSKGKTLRMWNDGVVSAATVPLRSDIVIEHWLGSGVSPQDLMAQGHQV
ncbi:MAG: beta-N-acetylhexosaminidase, partial [Nakamurella sp.]